MTQTFRARRLSKSSLLMGPLSIVIWGGLSVLFLSLQSPVARGIGLVMLLFALWSLISFVKWVTRKRGDLVIGPEAVSFASSKVYYKDMRAVDRGGYDLGKEVFEIVIRTDQGKHAFNVLDYQVAPEHAGTIFDVIMQAQRDAA